MKIPSTTRRKISFCKKLRQEQTEAEFLLWRRLKAKRFLGLKFRRQHPLPPYILDFYCPELNLCIELDGYFHAFDGADQKDKKRQNFIESKGIKVIRYPNTYIKQNLDDVLEDIAAKCQGLQSSP